MAHMFKVNNFGNLYQNKRSLTTDIEKYLATQCNSEFLIAIRPDSLAAYLNQQNKHVNENSELISASLVTKELHKLIQAQVITWIPSFQVERASK